MTSLSLPADSPLRPVESTATGMPPDNAKGQVIGFDAKGYAYPMCFTPHGWQALGWDSRDYPKVWCDPASFIVSHAVFVPGRREEGE